MWRGGQYEVECEIYFMVFLKQKESKEMLESLQVSLMVVKIGMSKSVVVGA